MGVIHIIALYVFFVILVAFYFIAKEIGKESKVSREQDFVTKLISEKKASLEAMNISLSIENYLRIMALAPIVAGILGYILSSSGLIAVIFGGIALLMPEAVANIMKHNRDKQFEERYARSLEQLSSSLRAGLSIAQAVEDVAECKFVHESMRLKYAKLSSDLQMGISVSEAFRRFAEGTGNDDAMDVAIAIDVQNEVGGHEAEVIEEIAANIHDRIMLRREIKSIFSGTNTMVWMMDFICPLTMIWFALTNREYVSTYFSSPLFMLLLLVFLVMMLAGSLINHRTVRKVQKGG